MVDKKNPNSKEKKTIQFKYVFDDEYNPKYANGVYGGVTNKAEFVLNFYHERHAIPRSTTHEIEENGQLGEMVEKNPENFDQVLIRYIVTGVTLGYGEAKNLRDWLDSMIKEFEQNIGIQEDTRS